MEQCVRQSFRVDSQALHCIIKYGAQNSPILESRHNVCAPVTSVASTLCNPVDCSPPGFSVHGILQARLPEQGNAMDSSPPGFSVHGILQTRIPEWVVVPSFRGSSPPRDRTQVSYIYLHWQMGSLPLVPPGKPRQNMGINYLNAHTTATFLVKARQKQNSNN